MKSLIIITLLVLTMAVKSLAQQARDNITLQQMANEDQQARMSGQIDWKLLNKQDSLRRVQVFELIKQNQVNTAKDHLNAGIIFQHGNDTTASAMAVKSFETALKLDSNLNRWWYAAAVDRDLMRRGKPQVFGTQFIRDRSTGRWKRYEIDSTKVSDQQRRYYRVETLEAQRQKEWYMNLKPIAVHYKQTNSIDSTVQFIKNQHKKSQPVGYSLETDINKFGYELLAQNKNEEALQIFKLNTILYPKAFNTYDSYGECLLKMGKKREAIKAYQKSLALNPKNENAQQVLHINR